MARNDTDTPRATDPERDFGVLLGWEADPAGERVMLRMQSASKAPKHADEVREFKYFLTREQAVLLGNYLYGLAGETAPRRHRRGWIERLIAR